MTNEQALLQLEALLPIGALKIITNEHDCGAGKHPDIPPFDTTVCDGYKHDVKDPRHFVIHAVTSMSPSRGAAGLNGQYSAYSAEGDFTQGQPEALLLRLTEVNKV